MPQDNGPIKSKNETSTFNANLVQGERPWELYHFGDHNSRQRDGP